MTTPPNGAGRFEKVKIVYLFIRELEVHTKIQREFRPKHAQKIADNFDPDLFKPLDVIRSRNRYLVFEGQHRLAAARIYLGEDQQVPCIVHDDVPLEQQARIALAGRFALAWTSIDQWGVRIIAREEVPLAIEAVLKRYDLRIERTAADGVIQAVGALEKLWNSHGGEATLDRTLDVLMRAFGRDRHAYDGKLLAGLGLFIHRLGDQIGNEELAAKLAKNGTPLQLIGQARALSDGAGISAPRAVAEKLAQVASRHRRGAALKMG